MNQNFNLLIPEFLLAGLAFLVLMADFVLPEKHKNTSLASLTVAGFIGILVFALAFLHGRSDALYCENPNTLYDCIYRIDSYTLFFKAFFLVIGTLVVLASVDFVARYLKHPGEYYALLIFSVLAMILMISSGELLTAYISLELLSFSLYALVSFIREGPKSNEAGVKYILLGALSSAILLYGISFIYTSVGDTRFDAIAGHLIATSTMEPALLAGIALIIAGLGFKVAAVPFHMWAPDIYEGAPLPITAFLAVASKTASFALFLRIFVDAFGAAVSDWAIVIALLAAVTMTIGNLVALAQHNIKRLLAYSSIGQAGYMLMGIAALSAMAAEGLMLHMVGYAATTLALFVGVIAVYNLTGKEEISDFDGLSQRAPFVALVISSALFSLAGLPFFAGFITKFYLFTAVAAQGFLWLAALAILNSLISLYYYLTIIRHMYIMPPQKGDEKHLSIPLLTKGLLGALLLVIVVIGVYPAPLVDTIITARSAIFP